MPAKAVEVTTGAALAYLTSSLAPSCALPSTSATPSRPRWYSLSGVCGAKDSLAAQAMHSPASTISAPSGARRRSPPEGAEWRFSDSPADTAGSAERASSNVTSSLTRELSASNAHDEAAGGAPSVASAPR